MFAASNTYFSGFRSLYYIIRPFYRARWLVQIVSRSARGYVEPTLACQRIDHAGTKLINSITAMCYLPLVVKFSLRCYVYKPGYCIFILQYITPRIDIMKLQLDYLRTRDQFMRSSRFIFLIQTFLRS